MRRLALLVAIALVGCIGCGGGSGLSSGASGTIKAAPKAPGSSSAAASRKVEATPFGKRVTAVCFAGAKKLGSLPQFPVPQFDPIDPKPSQLPQIGRFLAGGQLPAYRSLVAGLKKIEPPPAYRARYEELLAQLDSLLANVQRQTATAKAADVNGFVAAVKGSGGLGLPKAESALGITACYGIA